MSTPSAKAQSMKDKKDAVLRTAQISWTIRQQIRASLPTAEEQFLTVMVPGKVINFKDYIPDQDKGTNDDLRVQLNEAMLVDDMPATSGVQLGPTGRSIADSYATALDLLITTGTTIGVDPPRDPKNTQDPQTRYQTAMKWLGDIGSNGKTKIDFYKTYQSAYTKVFEEKTNAYNDALEKSRELYPDSPSSQDKHYREWVQAHHKIYSEKLQGAYMEWVVHGFKEQVEHYFALVDTTSPNARIEKAKQTMRDSTIATPDGATEFNSVNLSPSNWATIAKQAADQTLAPRGRTPDEIQFDIDRLTFKKLSLGAIKELPDPAKEADLAIDDTALNSAIKDMMTKSQAYDKAHKAAMAKKNKKTDANKPTDSNKPADASASSNNNASAAAGSSTTDANANANANADANGGSDKDLEADADNAKKQFDEARAKVLEQQQAYTAKAAAQLRLKIANQASDALKATKDGVASQITDIETKITTLKTELDNALKQNVSADDPLAGLVPSDPKSAPKASRGGNNDLANYWTRITCEVESSYKASQQSMDSTSYSVGGAASWGLFNIGGSYSHADATSKAASQMSNLSCSISFDVMRVDISRPWLQTTVFYDSRLDAAPTAKISPGPSFLRMLMGQADEMPSDVTLSPNDKAAALKEYNLFSHFSTGFLLAANVVLEFKGETSDISSYFHSSSTSASLSVGYGPFSVSGAYSSSSSDQNSTFQTTSEGCRIAMKAPQIIGWVSEILPSLPRLKEGQAPFPLAGWSSI